mmetsp:Transcript_62613/g.104217  ORF Transcript_62613/g.104217 Transcript_62613/m.104217 type:complete len:456 (+) Transcript_62613:70-1437(+)|eukprot:CAMPEP_0119305702 /NCGR_PEP_ID=MMETSP1333-20130426/6630_1 /TAXON_ID=418940 /ORGANISM="Scyphosphaera apsteinii, Strain RCC1455" /LENGTH=455 /DNA_ID=CAMNT_0007308861 /DNA_START=1620 /DNA_END=2987 /DNA_ORIENTATION=-
MQLASADLWNASKMLNAPLLPPTYLQHLPACVRTILARGVEQLMPLPADPVFADRFEGLIQWGYLLNSRSNTQRLAYQREQLPQLGLNVSVVRAYDAEDIDATVRSCTALASLDAYGTESLSIAHPTRVRRLSSCIKLYIALFDTAIHGWHAAFVFEDDVQIFWDRVDTLGMAMHNLSAMALGKKSSDALTVLFASSYSIHGVDRLCCDFGAPRLARRPRNVRGTGIMASVGFVVTSLGVRHLLKSLPIRDNIDVLLSDSRTISGRQQGLWYLKPYPFVPSYTLKNLECVKCLPNTSINPMASSTNLSHWQPAPPKPGLPPRPKSRPLPSIVALDAVNGRQRQMCYKRSGCKKLKDICREFNDACLIGGSHKRNQDYREAQGSALDLFAARLGAQVDHECINYKAGKCTRRRFCRYALSDTGPIPRCFYYHTLPIPRDKCHQGTPCISIQPIWKA